MSSIIPNLTEDVLELYGDRVIRTDGIERLQYYQEFETWYERSGYDEITRGRIYNYSEITEYLTILTVSHQQIDVANDVKLSKVPESSPLRDWSSSDWRGMRETLINIRNSMVRVDSNATLEEVMDDDDDDGHDHNPDGVKGIESKIDRELRKESHFNENFLELLKRFVLQERVAPFRKILEGGRVSTQPKTTKGMKGNNQQRLEDKTQLEDPEDFLEDFLDMMESDEDKQVKVALGYLLEQDGTSFKSPNDIQQIFNDRSRPFSFDKLIERTNRLIRRWVDLVFDGPTLAGQYVHDDDKRKEAKALERLHRSRARLDESVKDPLPDVVHAASRAKRPSKASVNHDDTEDGGGEDADEPELIQTKKRRSSRSHNGGRLIQQKKSAVQLVFSQDDSDEEDIEDPNEQDGDDEEILPGTRNRPALQVTTNMPLSSPRKKSKSQQKPYSGKRAWTQDERNAIKEGIKLCGKGNWALIKERFSHVLAERTSGQIKDCVRTMTRQGELNDLLGEEEENSVSEEVEAEAGATITGNEVD